MFEAATPGAEVIQQDDVRNAKLLHERLGFHEPRKIRGPHAAVDDRAGDPKSSSANFFASEMVHGLAGELFDDQIELRELLARKAMAKNRRELATLFRKQRQIAFGAADISRKNHQLLLERLLWNC